ncbi:hypothetical protein BJX64DRAFT_261430 [Aspergillus heterothallicus]
MVIFFDSTCIFSPERLYSTSQLSTSPSLSLSFSNLSHPPPPTIYHERTRIQLQEEMDLFTRPTKPNSRLPPILLARKNKEPATSLGCTQLATLSKQKLSKEASTGDPDLRRCLGHHRLLRRSIQEAQEDMKRYLDEVVEYESDSDDDDGNDADDEEEFENMDSPFDDGGDVFDECAKVHGGEVVFLGPRGRAREVIVQREGQGQRQKGRDRARSPCVKERFVDAVRGLMRRHTSPLPPRRAAASGKKEGATLRHALKKNNSCSNIPIYIHVHEHLGKGDTFAAGLEKAQTSEVQSEPLPFRKRGRKYAERLGLRR